MTPTLAVSGVVTVVLSLITAAAALIGVAIGKWFDRANEHRHWVRDKRFDAYSRFLTAAVHQMQQYVLLDTASAGLQSAQARVEELQRSASGDELDASIRAELAGETARASSLVDQVRLLAGLKQLTAALSDVHIYGTEPAQQRAMVIAGMRPETFREDKYGQALQEFIAISRTEVEKPRTRRRFIRRDVAS